MTDEERDRALDAIEARVAEMPWAGGMKNPRYFAECMVLVLSSNNVSEAIVFEELAAMVDRVAERQRVAHAQNLRRYADALVAGALS